MRSTASKIKQLQNENVGYATMIDHPLIPYVIIAATKVDVVRIVWELEKIPAGKVEMKKIYRVKINKAP